MAENKIGFFFGAGAEVGYEFPTGAKFAISIMNPSGNVLDNAKSVNGYHKSAVEKRPIKKVKYDTVHKRIQRAGSFIV